MSVTFAIGQKAVYPSRGIAEVMGIEKKEIHGNVQSFYVLRLEDNGLRILVPTDKAGQVGLRPVAGADDVEEVLQILREKAVRCDRHTWNRRYRGFMEKIKSGSLFEVAEVFRDLYRLKTTKTALVRRAPHAGHRPRAHRPGDLGRPEGGRGGRGEGARAGPVRGRLLDRRTS